MSAALNKAAANLGAMLVVNSAKTVNSGTVAFA